MKTQTSSQRGFSLIELLIVVAIIGIIAAITVTYLLQAKQAARSASAAHSMRLIHSCEAAYHASSGLYGDLNDLSTGKFLNDPDLRAGRKSGYNFTATPDTSTPSLNYVSIALPDSDPTGSLKNYFMDGSGVLRVNIGAAADAASMAVGN